MKGTVILVALFLLLVVTIVCAYLKATGRSCLIRLRLGTYTEVLPKPLPKPSAENVQAAKKALENLVSVWRAENWDGMWDQMASPVRLEEMRDSLIQRWKAAKGELPPFGGGGLENVRALGEDTSSFNAETHWVSPDLNMAMDPDDFVAKLTEGDLLWLSYDIGGKTYTNPFLREDDAWRPMVGPTDFPVDW